MEIDAETLKKTAIKKPYMDKFACSMNLRTISPNLFALSPSPAWNLSGNLSGKTTSSEEHLTI